MSFFPHFKAYRDHKPSYEALESSKESMEDGTEAPIARHTMASRHGMTFGQRVCFAVSVALNAALIIFSLNQKVNAAGSYGTVLPRALYSPAQHLLSLKAVKVDTGFGNGLTPFQGEPSPELDQMWEGLYQFGISRIPKSQAALLPNKTEPIPGDESHYVVELDVFHQIHCLNLIRQKLRPDYYKPSNPSEFDEEDELLGPTHISHCVDSIRQSLMCSSDISPVVWRWSDKTGTMARADIVRTCRDFDSLRNWALQHKIEGDLDLETRVKDDIVVPEFGSLEEYQRVRVKQ